MFILDKSAEEWKQEGNIELKKQSRGSNTPFPGPLYVAVLTS
jgi:hypothetical protein